MTTYHNDTLHLSYSYPAAYTDASSMVGPAFEASMSHAPMGGKDEARCITLPFSAMHPDAGGFAVVIMVRADAGCLKKTLTAEKLPEFTQGEVQGLSASGARTQFGQPVAFTAGDHAAELLRGTFELPTGQALHAMVVCVLLKPDIACWQFLGSGDEQLNTMSTFPLSVDGGAPVPLVPAAVLAKATAVAKP